MSFLSKFKGITHVAAVVGGTALAWAFSDQGQQIIGSVVRAYPKASVISTVLGFLAVLYHSPKSS